jgi:hypothetical protein
MKTPILTKLDGTFTGELKNGDKVLIGQLIGRIDFMGAKIPLLSKSDGYITDMIKNGQVYWGDTLCCVIDVPPIV